MANISVNNKRIAKNTLMLYGRMLVCMFISIYTSRLVLAALGETDYGVNNVVGGVVSMFSVLTGSLSSAISRFQTFELGKGDTKRLKNAFSSSLLIQLLMSVVIVVLVESIGVWFLNTHMTIPAERVRAANVVLQCCVASFVSSLLIVPYSASVVAHEEMGVFAVISVVEVVFKLLVALFLSYAAYKGDKLIFYAVALVGCTLTIQFIYRIYCHRRYAECRFAKPDDRTVFKEILSFAGWNFFGSASGLIYNQGTNIYLNMLFGPVVNAARGLSMTVSGIISNFVNSFTTAVDPQIVKSYASNDLAQTRFLVKRGTKFCYYVMLLLALPVMVEARFLMDLWLVDVPEHTVNFVRLTLLVNVTNVVSVVLGMGQMATGIIRNYQIWTGILNVLNFIIACIFLKLTGVPEIAYIICTVISIATLLMRLYYVRKYLQLSVREFVLSVCTRLAYVTILSSICPIVLHFCIASDWIRFLAVCFSALICTSVSVLYVGCDVFERSFIFDMVKSFLRKFHSV